LNIKEFIKLAVDDKSQEMFRKFMLIFKQGSNLDFKPEEVNLFKNLPKTFDEMVKFMSYRVKRLQIKKDFDTNEDCKEKFKNCLELFDLR
jgi:hypothetical protein